VASKTPSGGAARLVVTQVDTIGYFVHRYKKKVGSVYLAQAIVI